MNDGNYNLLDELKGYVDRQVEQSLSSLDLVTVSELFAWYSRFHGYQTPNLETLFEAAENLSYGISASAAFDLRNVEGLYSWYSNHGTREQRRQARCDLISRLDGSVEGIRAANLILQYEGSKTALSIVRRAIRQVSVQDRNSDFDCAVAQSCSLAQGFSLDLNLSIKFNLSAMMEILDYVHFYESVAKDCRLLLYKAEGDITPQESQQLCGHVARNKPFECVIDPLLVRVLYFKSPYSKSVLLSFDLVYVDEKWSTLLGARIEKALELGPSSVSVSATHTHTGPFVDWKAVHMKYIRYVMDVTLRTARKAARKGTEVTVSYAIARNDFGVNRRLRDGASGKIIMRPNPDGPYDRDIPVIAFTNDEGTYEAIIYNCSVHPTTIGVGYYAVSADYPGRIAYYLRECFGSSLVAVPFTGSCGDVRPAVLTNDGKSFTDGTPETVDRNGRETALAICSALENRVEAEGEADCRLLKSWVPFRLFRIPSRKQLVSVLAKDASLRAKAQILYDSLSDFEKAHDNPFWPVDLDRSWAEGLLKQRKISDVLVGQLNLLIINGDIALFFVPGELFSQLGMNIKGLWKGKLALLAGYSNGSLGYMPSVDAIREGGYEVECSYKENLMGGPFKDIEKDLSGGFRQMLEDYGSTAD